MRDTKMGTRYQKPTKRLWKHQALWIAGLAFLQHQSSLASGQAIFNCGETEIGVSVTEALQAAQDSVNEGSLSQLICGGRQLSGSLPGDQEEFNALVDLEILNLAGNALSGPIPAEIELLTDMVILDLSNNELEQELFDVSKMSKLLILNVELNGLTGEVFPALQGPVSIQTLAIGDNQFTKLNDDAIYPDLIQLVAQRNNFAGSIPSTLNSDITPNIIEIFLNDNQFTAIPDEFFTLSSLSTLDLSSNSISGNLIEGVNGMSSLRSLNLARNNFGGTIPAELFELTELTFLDLSDNQFTGTIPEEIGDLTNLQTLFLGGNALEGTVPQHTAIETDSPPADVIEEQNDEDEEGDADFIAGTILGTSFGFCAVVAFTIVLVLRKRKQKKKIQSIGLSQIGTAQTYDYTNSSRSKASLANFSMLQTTVDGRSSVRDTLPTTSRGNMRPGHDSAHTYNVQLQAFSNIPAEKRDSRYFSDNIF